MNFYGQGYAWHLPFRFPRFDIVTKTVTINKRVGFPYRIAADPFITKSVWNKVGLVNEGFYNHLPKLIKRYEEGKINTGIIYSISGTDDEIATMVKALNFVVRNNFIKLKGIELNYSCPNVKDNANITIPRSDKKLPLYLKLNARQNPYEYSGIERVKEIRLNSLSVGYGGVSGRLAQQENWEFIRKYHNNFKIAGASWVDEEDICTLYNMGVRSFGIGSVIMLNPLLVQKLEDIKDDLQL